MDIPKAVDVTRYRRISDLELEWWTNNPIDPREEWKHYDLEFGQYFEPWHTVADVGCGPFPYFYNGKIECRVGYAIDPWIHQYNQIGYIKDRFQENPTRLDVFFRPSIQTISDVLCDAVFTTNTLDHARNPAWLYKSILRILKPGGRLFFMVDIDKPPDVMHPHTLTLDWVLSRLQEDCDVVHSVVKKSYKFENDVLYWVGDKK